MLNQIQELLENYDFHLKEAQNDETWQWAMNDMSNETNASFGKALAQIELIKELIKDAKNNKSS